MEKKVIYRDRQEITVDDLNNAQDFSDIAQQHIVMDAITGERQFVGLVVTKKSATEIEISSGRLWEGATGCVYELAQPLVQSLFNMLPLSDEKWLAVTVFGVTKDEHIQPRDFLIDTQTGQTQPEAVAVERHRVVTTHIASGLESPTPQKPEPPTGYTLIAHVRLTPSGIEEIILNEKGVLPRLDRVAAQVWDIQRWRAQISPRVDTLTTDVAGLQAALRGSGQQQQYRELAAALARLQEQMSLPDGHGNFSADYFYNDSESDIERAEYHARTDRGLRMPWEALSDKALRFANPYEKAVKAHTGVILPAYRDVVRLETSNHTGSIPIASYQYQTIEYTEGLMTHTRTSYGKETRYISANGLQDTYAYDSNTNIYTDPDGKKWQLRGIEYYTPTAHPMAGSRGYLVEVTEETYQEPYVYTTEKTRQINGAQIAQTFLNAQNGYMTGIGLWFAKFDRSAPITVLITETTLGQPDLSRVVGVGNIDTAQFDSATSDVVARFIDPVYLQGGKRYAIVLITAGDHEVHIVSGAEYAQGTLFEAIDGVYFQGDNTRDLRMKLYFAHFDSARTVVNLEPLELAGGITHIDLKVQGVIPDGCELHYEYQINGRWIAIAEGTAENLVNLPPLLPVRMVFIGTSDLMPCIGIASQIRVSRPAKAFCHFSTQRTLTDAKDVIEVQVLAVGFDAALHTLDLYLHIDGNRVIPASTTDKQESDGIRRITRFELAAPTDTYSIELKGTTSTARECFHVAQRIDLGL